MILRKSYIYFFIFEEMIKYISQIPFQFDIC